MVYNGNMEKSYPLSYTIPIKCYNCDTRFDDDEYEINGEIGSPRHIEKSILIPRGTKIGDYPCPFCGCRTLGRWVV